MNNCPKIFYINMDSDIEKNDSMIEQLEKYNLVYIRGSSSEWCKYCTR